MKNLIMKMKKEEGFVSVETVVVAAIVIAVGIISYNTIFVGTLSGKITDSNQAVMNNTVMAMDYDPTL